MPKVSVIIPTYNREHFIAKTIRSVLEQTYGDFEIVIVDDGSTDGTRKELEQFGSKIKIVTQPNSERAVSRNNGVRNSSGKYIAFLDSDDLWIPDKLKSQVEILDSNPEIILTYGQSLRINKHGKEINYAKRQLQGASGNVFEDLLMRNFIASPTPIVRREEFDKTSGFQSKYIPYEDWEFWLRFSLLGKFYFINRPLAYYRIHEEQSVKNINAEKIEKVTFDLLKDSFNLKDIEPRIKNKSLGLANLRFGYWYLIAGNKEKAKEKLKKAINLHPKFVLDPRWHGLNLVYRFPFLQRFSTFKLEQYH